PPQIDERRRDRVPVGQGRRVRDRAPEPQRSDGDRDRGDLGDLHGDVAPAPARRRRRWRWRGRRRGLHARILARPPAARYRATVRAVAIVNGNARRVRGELRARLERTLPGGVRFTTSLDHARAVIRDDVVRGLDLVVLAGGDGTVVMGLSLLA